jgi:hypothetical protein
MNTAEVFILFVIVINQPKIRSEQSAPAKQDIAGVFPQEKKERFVGRQ